MNNTQQCIAIIQCMYRWRQPVYTTFHDELGLGECGAGAMLRECRGEWRVILGPDVEEFFEKRGSARG